MNVKKLKEKLCICKVKIDWLNANKRVISLVSDKFFREAKGEPQSPAAEDRFPL